MAETAFTTLYRTEFIKGFEQRQSLLRDTVTTEAMVNGNAAVFLVADSGSATAQTRGVNGLIAARADKHHHLRVTAIHRERNRHASSDEPWTKTPVAFFTDGRHETRHAITDDQYDQLAAIATDDDYHDHDYIAYNQPIQWHDVFSEDRA